MALLFVRKFLKIVSGKVVELCAFNTRVIKTPRGPRSQPTDPDHKARNVAAIIRRVARLLNCNFSNEDYFVTLTYSEDAYIHLCVGMPAGLSEDDRLAYVYGRARKEFDRFIRRCQYACKKAKVPLSFVGVTADRDRLDSTDKHVHHHFVVNGAAVEIVKQAWQNGFTWLNHLSNDDDYTPVAFYMITQTRKEKRKACYKASRNLKQPVIDTALSLDAWDIPENVKDSLDTKDYVCYCMSKV